MFKRPSTPPATTTRSFDNPFYAQEVIMSNLETVESTGGVPTTGVSVIQSQQASAVAPQQSAESRGEDSHQSQSAEAGASDKYV